jgi:uncharacterized damage-inducible protein DinB
MSVEILLRLWKNSRQGFIKEIERIPEDQLSFRATPETRSVLELTQHVIGSGKFFVGETCTPDTNILRRPFNEHTKAYGEGVENVTDKAGLIELLRSTMNDAEKCLAEYGDKLLNESMTGLDGKPTSKLAFLMFGMSHEMYHRGQLTVFERLLNVEPALTEQFRKLTASAS